MKNPPSSSEQALEDYFRDLLISEPVPVKGGDAVPFKATVIDAFSARPTAARLVRAADTPIPAASATTLPLRAFNELRPQIEPRPVEPRAYAEPIKTLNLRMPLPALAPAPAPIEVAEIAVEVPVAVAAVPPASTPEPVHTPVHAKVIAPEPIPVATPTPVVEAESEIAASDLPVAHAPAAWLDNGRPAWAQRPFECLLFKVGGLALAAPLAELGSIYPLEADMLTAIFGQAPWFMGLLPVKGYNVRAIDAAQVVMPERYEEAMRANYRYVITLHGSDWGLAVDSVANSVVLQPDQIRWRGQRSKRPWLAGTVVTQMCALLDVAQLIWMFQNQDGKRMAPQA